LAIQNVTKVHDLHIWSLSVGKPALSAHIEVETKPTFVLKEVTKLCR